jgi:hypothetical protein
MPNATFVAGEDGEPFVAGCTVRHGWAEGAVAGAESERLTCAGIEQGK